MHNTLCQNLLNSKKRIFLAVDIHNQEIMISCGQRKKRKNPAKQNFFESNMTIVIINDDDVHWFISTSICIIVS